MANELQISLNGSYAKNGATDLFNAAAQVTVTSNYISSGIASVGTVDETISLGDVSTVGFIFLKNLDDTNFVEIGSDGSSYPLKLKAGEALLTRWNAAAIHAKADTATVNLQYKIYGD